MTIICSKLHIKQFMLSMLLNTWVYPRLNIKKTLQPRTKPLLRCLNISQKLNQYVTFLNFCIIFLILTLPLSTSHYVNKWSLQVNGDGKKVREIVTKHGFELVDEVVPGVWEIVHHRVKKVSYRPSHSHHHILNEEKEVIWHQQQSSLLRQKRDYFTDPDWPSQWYMNQGKNDMRILGNYNKYRMTGRGVVVTILDDGIEFNHTDLAANYDPEASYDFNDKDPDPFPRYEYTNFNKHGTRCAGEVAAVANNSKCGVGIAYNAKIGGIRLLDGRITDNIEARSLYFHSQHIHIYSASWGPTDSGNVLEGPGRVSQKAMHLGVTKGRGGFGSIYVWASGNGGRKGDNCNCDGYTSNVFTTSISAADKNGNIPPYNERCSSTLATTYSSGSASNYDEPDIVTTDLHNMCTKYHSGTSASAPMAAGIFALALEANPLLTWRDLQHLVVMTSHKGNLKAADWTKNGVGRIVSHNFGYGLLDAEELVKAAVDWVTVPEQVICVVSADFKPVYLTEYSNTSIDLTIQKCHRTNLTLNLYKYHQRKQNTDMQDDFEEPTDKPLYNKRVKFLEHVQALVTVATSNRGQVELHLTSPQGTVSQLLSVRQLDNNKDGIHEWPFTTVHNWGERSEGLWKLTVFFHNCTGTLSKWSLVLYGTEEDPMNKTSYPPRNIKPTEKTCKEGEYYLNEQCHKSCPTKHFPSTGLLSITPSLGHIVSKRSAGDVNNVIQKTCLIKEDDNNSISNTKNINDRDKKNGGVKYENKKSADNKIKTHRGREIKKQFIKNTKTPVGKIISEMYINPSIHPTHVSSSHFQKAETNPSIHSFNQPTTNLPRQRTDSNPIRSQRRHFGSHAKSTSNNKFYKTRIANIYIGEINNDALMKEGQEILKVAICYPCHASCLSCTGNHKNECLKCVGGYYLTTDQRCIPKKGYENFFQKHLYIILIISAVIGFILIFIIILVINCRSVHDDSHPYKPIKTEEESNKMFSNSHK